MDFIGPLLLYKVTIKNVIKVLFLSLYNIKKSYINTKRALDQNNSVLPRNELDGFNIKFPDRYNSKVAYTYILLIVDYFNRFIQAFPTISDSLEEVIRCLTWIYNIKGPPVIVYTNLGSYFLLKRSQAFIKGRGVLFIPAPIKAKKATSIAEKYNYLLETIIELSLDSKKSWPLITQKVVFKVNRREILYIRHSLFEIKLGY